MVSSVKPLCRYFEECGGCQYQHLSYPDELALKRNDLVDKLKACLSIDEYVIQDVLPSPQEYYYRHRLDLRLLKTKNGTVHIGFTRPRQPVLEIDSCVIARREIDQFIPQLKKEAVAVLPDKYRLANLTVRSGDDCQVRWGGIGKGSLRTTDDNYMWTEINGKRIHYGMDTFFQSNLFILPSLFEHIRALPIWDQNALFFDLYGGVGLFGLCVSDLVKEVCLIEENPHSARCAQFNATYNKLGNFHVHSARVEEVLQTVLEKQGNHHHIVMVDPPRSGLSDSSVTMLNGLNYVGHLLYLSCNPETLIPNLKDLTVGGGQWQIESILPCDFFPKTRHLEVLTHLVKK